MLYFTFFCTISLVIYGSITWWKERNIVVKRRLSIFVDQTKVEGEVNVVHKQDNLWRRFFYPIWKEFKKSFKRKIPGKREAKLEMKLLQAGSPFGMTTVDFRLLQISLFFLFPVVFGLYASFLRAGIGGIMILSLIGMIIGLVIPRYYLHLKKKKRALLALRELPDVLDLLTVSLEAGLGFDSALSKLISKKTGVLAHEFHRCLEEIRLGRTRREALTGIRERLAVDEVKILISSIIQAEKLGIGLVQVLRVQSEEVRMQRKQRAEEEAMKAPIKMMFPLVLFIFPSIFIVLLGPAVIQFVTTFSK